MSHLSEDPLALAEFFGVLVECPLLGGNPNHCQLHHVRTLELQARYEWAKGLETDEARQMQSKCSQCMARQRAAWGLTLR